jgi:creatinine amidohydrolase
MHSYLLEDLSWFDVQEYLKSENLIILPIGSIEQQGPHLPLGTDSINTQYIAIKAAEKCQVLVGPTIKLGVSYNHLDFPGTITLRPETLIDLLVDSIGSLAGHGFRKILLLNGHGGNNSSVETAAIKLRFKFRDLVVGVLNAWNLLKESVDILEFNIRYHADEAETSRTLVTAPDLVNIDRAKREVPESKSGLFPFQVEEVFNQVVFYGLPRSKAVTKSGVFGDPSIGTKEKGLILLKEQIENLVHEVKRLKALNLEDYTEG